MRRRLLPFLFAIATSLTGCIATDRTAAGSRVMDDEVPVDPVVPGGPVVFPNAPITSPIQRFDTLLNSIQSTVTPLVAQTPEQRVSSLRFSGITQPLRYFQELVTIYGKKFEALDAFDVEAKKLEDFVAHYGDYESFLSAAQGSGNPEAIAKAQAALDKLKADFLAYATDSAWFAVENNYVAQIRAVVSPLATTPLEYDRNYVLKRIAKKIKKQAVKVYNFDLVEEGMHELRRDARRIEHLNTAATQILRGDRQDTCPMLTPEQWAALPDEAKANPVPAVVPDPPPAASVDYFCHISGCLFQDLSAISQNLALLKTEAASYEAQGKPVPPELIEQAKQMHDKSAQALTNMFLWSQIRSCMTPGGDGDADEE